MYIYVYILNIMCMFDFLDFDSFTKFPHVLGCQTKMLLQRNCAEAMYDVTICTDCDVTICTFFVVVLYHALLCHYPLYKYYDITNIFG